MPKKLVTLSLVFRSEENQILDFLDGLLRVGAFEHAEILIIDNDSSDDTVSRLREWQTLNPQVDMRLIHRSINHMAQARQQALEEARTPWVYFIDADCRLMESSWNLLLKFCRDLVADTGVAAFGGGNICPPGPGFVAGGLQELRQNWMGHMGSIQVRGPLRVSRVNLLSTCNLVVRREMALSCGGFDSRFEKVGEDLSLCLRLRSYGKVLLAVPGMEVLHLQGMPAGKWAQKMFRYGEAQIHAATFYPRHFLGMRGLQFLSVCFFLVLCVSAPAKAIFILMIYMISILVCSLIQSEESFQGRIQGFALIMLSQFFYAMGELSAIFTLPWKAFFTLPAKTPQRENT